MMTEPNAKGNLLSPEELFDLHPATYGNAQRAPGRVMAEVENPNTNISQVGSKARTYRDERLLREHTLIERYFEHFSDQVPNLKTIQDVSEFLETRFPDNTFDRQPPPTADP